MSRPNAGGRERHQRRYFEPDPIRRLFASDDPTDLMPPPRAETETNPYRKLWLAVLEEALRLLAIADVRGPSKPAEEALHWVLSERLDYPFAFEVLTDALGINPEYVRRLVVNGAAKRAYVFATKRIAA